LIAKLFCLDLCIYFYANNYGRAHNGLLWPLVLYFCISALQLHSIPVVVALFLVFGIRDLVFCVRNWDLDACSLCLRTFGFVIKIFLVLFRFRRSPYHNVLCPSFGSFLPCEHIFYFILFSLAFFCQPTFWRFSILISGSSAEFNYAAARVFLSRLTFCLMINNNAVFQRQPACQDPQDAVHLHVCIFILKKFLTMSYYPCLLHIMLRLLLQENNFQLAERERKLAGRDSPGRQYCSLELS